MGVSESDLKMDTDFRGCLKLLGLRMRLPHLTIPSCLWVSTQMSTLLPLEFRFHEGRDLSVFF